MNAVSKTIDQADEVQEFASQSDAEWQVHETPVLEFLGSVKLAIVLLVVTATAVLLGSWCPQESQAGREKIVEQFGKDGTFWLEKLGITDIFHTPFFLLLIAMLSTNLLVASMQRVFPRAIIRWKAKLEVMDKTDILRLPIHHKLVCRMSCSSVLEKLQKQLHRAGYGVKLEDNRLAAQRGKLGGMAAAVTHVGLLSLLAGVTVTSWTGFTGFEPVLSGGMLDFARSQHSKLWIGRLPDWRVRVDNTRRVNYENGDPKQWYSNLSVVNAQGKVLKQQEISVNNPLSYDGVDIYQSGWDFDRIAISINETKHVFNLQRMGAVNAAFLPLDAQTIMIFSVRDSTAPLRLFAKTNNWPAPKLITTIAPGQAARLGTVLVRYDGAVPTTGLQYKSDPGFPISYGGFIFIIAGVLLAALPHRQVFAYLEPAARQHADNANNSDSDAKSVLFIGGSSSKAKRSFEQSLHKMCSDLKSVPVEII